MAACAIALAIQPALATEISYDTQAAAINADGSIARRGMHGIVSASHLKAGAYEVDSYKDIKACFYEVTVGEPGASSTGPAYATVAQRSGTADGLYIETYNASGTQTDEPLYVLILC